MVVRRLLSFWEGAMLVLGIVMVCDLKSCDLTEGDQRCTVQHVTRKTKNIDDPITSQNHCSQLVPEAPITPTILTLHPWCPLTEIPTFSKPWSVCQCVLKFWGRVWGAFLEYAGYLEFETVVFRKCRECYHLRGQYRQNLACVWANHHIFACKKKSS